jgi:Raf kinase inhibitor-like YbhB/YbcL family protein
MPVRLTSGSFEPGGPIPPRHTADGEDVSPPLAWFDPPEGARSYVLVVDDPDAPGGTWTHWVLYDIPREPPLLPEGRDKLATITFPFGAKQARNDFGRIGWNGPAPPPGPPHRYVFRLYALSRATLAPAGTTRDVVERAMKALTLDVAELTGTYARGTR